MKRFLFLPFVLGFALACSVAPTKPNVSALYQVSSLSAGVQLQFQRLHALDSTLAIEVGKLPEFQGKVADKQTLALTWFTDLIQNATPEEKANLAKLLKVGKPEVRCYCTPLQAVFWLFEKDEYSAETNPLQLSLRELLDKAWGFDEEQRWKNYGISTDRLNAPELVNYYQRERMKYDWDGKIFQIYGGDRAPNPKYLFRNNEGTCRDFAAFSVYCLRKGGYKAKIHLVENPDKRPTASGMHKVCLFEGKDGREYIMDNGRPNNLRRLGIVPAEKYNPFYP